ncbi:hypothetical protein BDV93DRAFT_475845 [Ceratobasidium sp. AG-I]|nr:hypothetical protein BDV93DRAFT_475845 [Ceratobasidium sp. AG-I]
MNSSDNFTVVVRGVGFTLTRSQVEFDGPNYFTACFLGNFKESQTRSLEVSRDPVLFGIVFDYLCGYTVLPLSADMIPKRMSLANALINLRVDADFYQLDGLVQMCDMSANPSLENKANCMAIAGSKLDIRYAARDFIPFVESFEEFRVAFVSKEEVLQDFPDMATPHSSRGFQGIRELATITKIVGQQFKSYDKSNWSILGWHTARSPSGELLIILEKSGLA